MGNITEHLFLLLKEFIGSMGYIGIAFGMLFESACIPIPSEMVLPLAGFMVADGKINLILANAVVALACLMGSLGAYAVGYYGGRPFILNYGKYFLVSADHFYKAEGTFKKYGSMAVFSGRLLPVVRSFISLPAGIARMDIKKFIAFSLGGMLPWNFALIFLGLQLGKRYDALVQPIFKKFEYIVVGAVVLLVVYFIFKVILANRKVKDAL
jgi:membrane protein DedA with SNARE-associated domain